MRKRTAQKDTIIGITKDNQVNSNFQYRWSPASLTFNNYFYLFLYLYITRITTNNNAPNLKSPKNQNRRAALGRPAIKLTVGLQLNCGRPTLALSSALVPQILSCLVCVAQKLPKKLPQMTQFKRSLVGQKFCIKTKKSLHQNSTVTSSLCPHGLKIDCYLWKELIIKLHVVLFKKLPKMT